MRRLFVPTLILLAAFGVGACEPAGAGTSIGSPRPAEASRPGTLPQPSVTKKPVVPYRVTYGWAVPSRPARVPHTVVMRDPPAPPFPFLVRIQVGDHPGENPAYTRITFAFDGPWPTYEIAYQRELTQDGSGHPVPLPGNSVLRITFTDAQAHDDQGRQTERPGFNLGYPTLKGYGFGGDFEGQVTYGLGIQARPNSDQALPIRVGELVRADGTYVVAVDVQRA
ncbi:hypothetical protein Ais01nite_57420 [Asanoa ishikariensis]|uniref:AMIN-like domain-containing protein n=1 Tax=Asanoa ishikariensis TaxID=137265 RepID=A0A1H3TYG1_9ACTN|nr:hypothetical protein [Asanoa ishikariensis]GIF67707.1 hypothetical protein Ais01nite_57420 [Asanoa ishikariensis]SDZ55273.1 hypothetical protein SAMN05421684_6604 [Asanoa ishikariensis]